MLCSSDQTIHYSWRILLGLFSKDRNKYEVIKLIGKEAYARIRRKASEKSDLIRIGQGFCTTAQFSKQLAQVEQVKETKNSGTIFFKQVRQSKLNGTS